MEDRLNGFLPVQELCGHTGLSEFPRQTHLTVSSCGANAVQVAVGFLPTRCTFDSTAVQFMSSIQDLLPSLIIKGNIFSLLRIRYSKQCLLLKFRSFSPWSVHIKGTMNVLPVPYLMASAICSDVQAQKLSIGVNIQGFYWKIGTLPELPVKYCLESPFWHRKPSLSLSILKNKQNRRKVVSLVDRSKTKQTFSLAEFGRPYPNVGRSIHHD